MAATTPRTYDLEADTARRLAETGSGPVLSVYVDLEPSEFATPPARSAQVRSLVDEAGRQVRAAELSHEEEVALRRDLDEVTAYLERGSLPANGARAVAVFRSSSSDLFDVVRLSRRAAARVVVDDTPYVEPLVEAAPGADWCVLLVNRRVGRMFRGTAGSLEEVARVTSDTHGQHDQGGWSQRNYEASVENEAAQHVRRTIGALFRRYRLRPFDHLLVGAPPELVTEVEEKLHPYLRERLAGRVEIDVENTTAADVRQAAAPRIEERETLREREVLDRLQVGVARPDGHGTSGLGTVLEALAEQRVEALLIAEGYTVPGVVCPACGWLGPENVEACPADGTATQRRDDIVERMVERALEQSAEVLVIRRHPDLGPHGGVGAVLRF
ncbi:MAG: Vms1/Ankzf1 family peptidyl-tRNA hydrolase [Thermoleophilaceae bacterium]